MIYIVYKQGYGEYLICGIYLDENTAYDKVDHRSNYFVERRMIDDYDEFEIRRKHDGC